MQAVFLAVTICRRAALAGDAQQYAAYSLLQHLDSTVYSSNLPGAVAAPTEVAMMAVVDGVDEAPERSLFEVIASRCHLPQHDQEEELLVAVQRAMTELTEWHDALSLKDMMATCGRAVATNAVSYLQPVMLSEALVSATAVPHSSITGGSCRLSAEGVTGDSLRSIGIELLVCERPVAEQGRPQGGTSDSPSTPVRGASSNDWNLWGGSSCLGAAPCIDWQKATVLAERVAHALSSRLQAGTCWEMAGLPRDCQKAVSVHVDAAALDGGSTPQNESGAAMDTSSAVCVQLDVDAQAVAREQPQQWQECVHACLDVVISACMDLIRYASLHSCPRKIRGCCIRPPFCALLSLYVSELL